MLEIKLFFIFFVAASSPGPDILLVIHNQSRGGVSAALLTLLGIFTGNLWWILLSIFGLSSGWLPNWGLALLSLCGGLYLVSLGLKSIKQKSVSELKDDPKHSKNYFTEGLLTNLLNAKAFLFFPAILGPILKEGRFYNYFTLIGAILSGSLSAFASLVILTAYLSKTKLYQNIILYLNKLAAVFFIFLGLSALYYAYTLF